MKFIGREYELSVLEKMYSKNSFQMMVLYGRRRIGKTTLLNKFSEDKKPLFYTGVESKNNGNLREFGEMVISYFMKESVAVEFRSFSDLFSYITSSMKRAPKDARQLIIIDEYPYMAESAAELSSALQREIDKEWSNMNVMLILCGSSITFMEEEVLGEKSPLFGRRTGQIDLLPFDYKTSAQFVPDYSPEEKAIVYGITGGIPKYLSILDPSMSLSENIIDSFFQTAGYFYEEPQNLMRQEFRDVSLYNAILNAIGGGSTQFSEIANKTGFDTAKVSQALKKLEAVRIIRKDIPLLNEKNKKLTQYTLYDGMFRFWYRFIPKGIAAIERNMGEMYYHNAVEGCLHDYMGGLFEIICQEYTFLMALTGSTDFFITRIGKWRGHDNQKRCPADIDVIGVDDTQKTAIIGECKFKNSAFGKEEYETMVDRARLLTPYMVNQYLIFSLSGVTEWVEAHKETNVKIVTMEDLYV